jgi:O-antigen/teichoic acid export membrane protein
MLIARMAGYGVPIVVSTAVRIAAIPIVTFFVGPAEVGTFAVLLATSAIFTVISSSLGGYVLSHRYRTDDQERHSVVLTCVAVEFVLAVAGAIIFIAAWPIVGAGNEAPMAAVFITAASIPAGAPWLTILTVIYIEGRPFRYALCQSLAPVAQLGATATALSAGLGVTGLAIGYFATQCVTLLFAVTLLSPGKLRMDILANARSLFGLALASNVMEAVMAWAERYSLAHGIDARAAGLYAHSQNYRSVLNSAAGAATRAIYPKTMDEARSEPIDFAATARLWRLLFIGMGACGIAAAFVGPQLVSILTHGKFTAAGPLLPWWCMILILQQSARPQHFALLARGHGKLLSLAKLIATMAGAALAFALTPVFGLFGPVFALIAKEIVHRGALYGMAWRLWRIRFYDTAAVASLLAISAAVWLGHFWGIS